MKRGEFCPFLKKDCVGHQCKMFVHLTGTNPQTGQPVDEFDCSLSWLPVLLVEGAKETRQAAAAVESLRNVVAKARPVVVPMLPERSVAALPAQVLEPRP